MKLNGSSNIYIMNKSIAHKTRLDAFEDSVNTYLPNHEKYHYKANNGAVAEIISTHHNYDDSKLILKRLISTSGLLGVDVLLVTFQTIFKGDSIRTAYKMCYTCGASMNEHYIFDLEAKGHELSLMDEIIANLNMPKSMINMVEDMYGYNSFKPLFKNVKKIKYTAGR